MKLPATISARPAMTTGLSPKRRPSMPPGIATRMPGSIHTPISRPSVARSMPKSATSNGDTAATDWNWKPMAVRAKNSTASMSQGFTADSLRLDAGRLRDARGVLDLAFHEAREFRRRHAHRLGAQAREALENVGHLHGAHDVAVDALDDRGRRAGRRPQAVPERELEAGDAGFGDRRRLGEELRALARAHAEGHEAPVADERQRERHRIEGEGQAPGDGR